MTKWFSSLNFMIKLFVSLLGFLLVLAFPVVLIQTFLYFLKSSPDIFSFSSSLFSFNITNTIDSYNYISLYLTIIGIIVSIFLTYAIFHLAKTKEQTELQKYRSTVYYQTIQSLKECLNNRPSKIILMDSVVNASLSLREILDEEEFTFLNEIWKQLQSVNSLIDDPVELDKHISILKGKIFLPFYWIIIRDFVNIFNDNNFAQLDLLNDDTLRILGKISTSKESRLVLSKKNYFDGSAFFEPYDFTKDRFRKFRIFKKGELIYDGEFENNEFTGKGQKIEHGIIYEGNFLKSKKSGFGVEKTIKEKRILIKGEWENNKFQHGQLFDVFLTDSGHYQKVIISDHSDHYNFNEIPPETDESLVINKKIGDVTLGSDGSIGVSNIREVQVVSGSKLWQKKLSELGKTLMQSVDSSNFIGKPKL